MLLARPEVGWVETKQKRLRLITEKKETEPGTPNTIKRTIVQGGDFDRTGDGKIQLPNFEFGRRSFADLSSRTWIPTTVTSDCISADREDLG